MNPRPSFLLASLAATFLSAAPAQAVIFLVDPSNVASPGTSPNFASGASQPYPVASTDLWNSGSDSSFGSGVYADGTAATGVTIVTDSLAAVAGNPSAFEYNFTASPETHPAAQANMGGVFQTNPTNTSMFGNNVTLGYGGVAMKITGLPSGTYDLYLVAAYTGATAGTRPGAVNAAQQNVWAFSQASGVNTIASGSYGSANDLLENGTTASWVQGNNYSKITVTLDAANPDLIIIAEGIAGGTETRGWLSSVQIIPEPSSSLLAAAGAIGLITRRRRVA